MGLCHSIGACAWVIWGLLRCRAAPAFCGTASKLVRNRPALRAVRLTPGCRTISGWPADCVLGLGPGRQNGIMGSLARLAARAAAAGNRPGQSWFRHGAVLVAR